MTASAQNNVTDYAYLELLHTKVWQRNLARFTYVIVIGTVGLVGNSLTLVVYSRKRNIPATHVFIIALAIVDLTTDVVVIPVVLYVLWHGFKVDEAYLCKLFYFLNFSTALISVVLLVAVAYVRYRKVCHSFGRHISKKTARRVGILIVVVSLVACIPHYIVHGRQIISIERLNVKGHLCGADESYVEGPLPLLVYGVFTAIFLLCSASLAFMYARIGVVAWGHGSIYGARVNTANGAQEPCNSGDRWEDGYATRCSNNPETSSSLAQLQNLAREEKAMENKNGDTALDLTNIRYTDSSIHFTSLGRKRKSRLQKSASARQGHNTRTTRMLLVITAIYIFSNLTSLMLILVRAVAPEKVAQLGTTEVSIFNVFVASYLINTAANPIMYSVYDRNFRLHCRTLVR